MRSHEVILKNYSDDVKSLINIIYTIQSMRFLNFFLMATDDLI